MLKTFKVLISDRLESVVDVEANSEEEAIEIAIENNNNGLYEIDHSQYTHSEITIYNEDL